MGTMGRSAPSYAHIGVMRCHLRHCCFQSVVAISDQYDGGEAVATRARDESFSANDGSMRITATTSFTIYRWAFCCTLTLQTICIDAPSPLTSSNLRAFPLRPASCSTDLYNVLSLLHISLLQDMRKFAHSRLVGAACFRFPIRL